MDTSSPSELFADCNHTELYQICRRLGLPVQPSTPKETLIAYLTGDEEAPSDVKNVIDTWRMGLMGFLLDHWEVVRSQLECPAKSGDPKACFNCADAQVVSCIVQNPEEEHLIQLKRKDP